MMLDCVQSAKMRNLLFSRARRCYGKLCRGFGLDHKRNALSFVSDDFHYVLSYSCPAHPYATTGHLFCQKSKSLSVEINETVIS
jgi:hypothetical protein